MTAERFDYSQEACLDHCEGKPVVLSTHGLTKDFKKLRAVDDLSISVCKGDVFGFLGPNGCGKTTTIRMLFGLIYPTSGYAQVLEDTLRSAGVDGVVQQSLTAIERSVRRMEVMIRDLVDSTRWEGGQLILNCRPIRLRRYVDELLDRLALSLDIARVRDEIPPDLPPVAADRDRLERIIVNLLSNALKYSPPTLPVTIP